MKQESKHYLLCLIQMIYLSVGILTVYSLTGEDFAREQIGEIEMLKIIKVKEQRSKSSKR